MTARDALPVPKAPLLISLLELEQCLRARLDFARVPSQLQAHQIFGEQNGRLSLANTAAQTSTAQATP